MRKRALAALLLVLALLLCGAAPAEEGLPVVIDGLLSARAFLRDGEVLVPVRALAAACSQPVEWLTEGETLTLSIGPLRAEGTAGKQYLLADGRYVWTPGGWMLRGEELYLPVETLAKLFGVEAGADSRGVTVRTKNAALLQGGEDYYALNVPADDFYWLTHIIHAEAGIEPIEGKIGVGNVVMNRVRSETFPNTVFEVIYDTEHVIQFEPVAVGAIREEADEDSVAAACMVLEGANTVGDSLYFFNPSADVDWFDDALRLEKVIGRHRFYVDRKG